jgi:actin cytoskeleton-regulatory complex protein SLA1
MATEAEEYLAVLKASYDYDPQSEDEIAMQENQLLFLLERVDDE